MLRLKNHIKSFYFDLKKKEKKETYLMTTRGPLATLLR